MSNDRQKQRVRRDRPNGGGGKRGSRGRYAGQWSADRLQPKPHLTPPAYASMGEVPQEIYHRALTEKLPWIQRFVNEGCPRGKLREYAVAHAGAQNIAPEQIPPYTTLNTWVHRHQAFGLLGLMDAVRGDAGKARTISPEVAETLRILRVGGKQGPMQALRSLHQLFEKDQIPTYAAVRRFIRTFERNNPHLIVMADEGIAGWRNKYRLALAGTEYPGGHALALDSTVMDLWVRVPDRDAPDGWRAVRMVLTVVSCVGSRLLVTYNLSFKAIDSGILLGTFRRAVNQDANYPGLLSPGIPRKVIVDAGAENKRLFKKTLTRLGVEVSVGSGYHPERNGREERLIETVQTEVLAALPGYAKTHKRFHPYAPAEKEQTRRLTSLKYEPYRLELPVTALQTPEQVEAQIAGWAQVYNARPHVGLPADSPELMALLAKAAEFDEIEEAA